LQEADTLFKTMLKKFGSKSPELWINYGHFLHAKMGAADRARQLLTRVGQVFGSDAKAYIRLYAKFASLEYHSPSGSPEAGRTLFEGLLSRFPRKYDLWLQLLDLEINHAGSDGDQSVVRDIFDRCAKGKALKPKNAENWFRRWADWEERMDPKGMGREKVMAKAQEWATNHKARKAAEAEAEAEAQTMEE
jgi:rRNA biogenesis protein RRP5